MEAVLEARRGDEIRELGRFKEHWVLHEALRVACEEESERWDAAVLTRGEAVELPDAVNRRLCAWHVKWTWPLLPQSASIRHFQDRERQGRILSSHEAGMEAALREGLSLRNNGWCLYYRAEDAL